MKKKFKRILALALSVMMVLSLAACGNSNTGNSNTTNGSAQTDAGTSAAAFEATTASNLENVIDAARDNQSGSVTGDTAAPVQQEPSSRGETTIVTTIASDPGGFDLALSNSMNTEYGIYQSLLTYGYNGYEPGIWSDYEIADDGMSISFTIDDNIFTTDGYHITADDVIWSIGLHKDGICANYASIFDMETSKSTGDYTGVLGLSSEFYPFMLDQCCHLGVTSQEGYEKSEDHYYYTAAGSTGPYKIKEYKEGVEIDLVKNEDYRGGYATQNVDNIIIKIVSEASQRLLMLESGDIDVIVNPNSSDLDYIQSLDGIEVANEFSHMQFYMAFNVIPEGPLQNQKVRQAICYAIDNESLIQSVYKGWRTAAISPVNPIVKEWDEAKLKAEQENNIYKYDVEKAKELLKEAGYENGFTCSIAYSSNEAGMDLMSQVIQGMLLQIGVQLEIQPYDRTSFKTLSSGSEGWDICLDKCKLQDSVLFPWNDKSNQKKQSIGGWYDEEFQTLLDEAIYTLDDDKIQRMLEIYNDVAGHYHLVYNTAQFGYRTGIEDFRTRGDNQLCPGDWTYDYENADWLFD